jgi:hypothetical protein
LSSENARSPIKDADASFENKPIKVVAVRSSPEIELTGLKVGPFDEGNEYEIRFWIARELEKVGLVRPREETLNASRLYPILHRERIQPISNLSSLPDDFYPRLRRVLEDLKGVSKSSPEKMREYEHVQQLSQDIADCRLKKIITLASTQGQKGQILRSLTAEELILYEELGKIITEWRRDII